MRMLDLLSQFKFKVTFNDGDYDLGGYDEGGDTIDFVGNDLDELVAEVIADSPNFPMRFVPAEDMSGDLGPDVVGAFYEAAADDYEDGPVALVLSY